MSSRKSFALIALLVAGVFAQLDYNSLVWPMPQQSSIGSDTLEVDPDLQINCAVLSESTSCSDLIQSAFDRYISYIFFVSEKSERKYHHVAEKPIVTDGTVSSVYVNVAKYGIELSVGVGEYSELSINQYGNVTIYADTEWGAIRALETLSQLINWQPGTNQYFCSAPTEIIDYPRFSWRGFLIDSARHYLLVEDITRQIDAMSFAKMNVLHWHITDDQSFPLVSEKFPTLAQDGAYSPFAVYTPEDVQFIVEYARQRGIIVVPEFDSPGHATSWQWGLPQLSSNCNANLQQLINPTADDTYAIISAMFTEFMGYFTSDYLHIGGDEVTYDCWENNTDILAWMESHNIPNVSELHNQYVTNIEQITTSLGKTPIVWEESFDNGFDLTPETIVSVWMSNAELEKVLESGRQGLLYSGNYLDRMNPGPQKFWIWQDSWMDFYWNEPTTPSMTDAEIDLILGGAASIWGDRCDGQNIDAFAWPRALAVGERLWSAKTVNDTDEAVVRLSAHRCRLVRRGIGAGPVEWDYCLTGSN